KVVLAAAASLSLIFCASSQKKKPRDPEKDPQYQYEKGVVAMRYELIDQAIEYFNQAIALDPLHAPSYNLLGYAQFKKKNFGAAAQSYQKYLGLKPNDSEARANLGIVYEELGMMLQAEAEYQKGFATDGNPNAAFGLAKVYYKQNKLEGALDYVKKAVQKTPGSAAFLNLQGVVLNEMGRYAEALSSFERALKITPHDLYLGVNLGIAYINNKEPAKAREIFEKILPEVQDDALKAKINEYLRLIKDNIERLGWIELAAGRSLSSPEP
ncbi:MAG: tetratricopeptide repeat protein, partial [Acidobacteriota bacterium]